MKTPLEQFSLGLRLVIPITASPRPRVSRDGTLWNYNDAPSLAVDMLKSVFFFVCRPKRHDIQVRFIHQKIVSVKPMPGRLLPGKSRFATEERTAGPGHDRKEKQEPGPPSELPKVRLREYQVYAKECGQFEDCSVHALVYSGDDLSRACGA
jgi:hypothetical protein